MIEYKKQNQNTKPYNKNQNKKAGVIDFFNQTYW